MLRVFIADESEAVRRRLAAMVSELEGVELVGQAGNALAAIEGIHQLKPQVAILDIRMPSGNSIQAIRAVKAVIPCTQIIMLTVFPYPQYKQKCLEAGADFFFDKSSEFEAVIELLRKFSQSDEISPPLRLLAIEDNPSYAFSIRNFLREAVKPRFCVVVAEKLASGLELMAEPRFDLILLDLGLPDSNGIKTLQLTLPQAGNTPILVMMDSEDDELAFEAVRLGAQDYLVKSHLDGFSLPRLIRYAIERKHSDRTIREKSGQRQQYLPNPEVIVLSLDHQGVITSINRKGSHLLGYEEQELIGQNWFETCLPAKVSASVKADFHQMMSGRIDPLEDAQNPILTKSGHERLINWHNTILKDRQGNITGSLSAGEDITGLIQDVGRIKP